MSPPPTDPELDDVLRAWGATTMRTLAENPMFADTSIPVIAIELAEYLDRGPGSWTSIEDDEGAFGIWGAVGSLMEIHGHDSLLAAFIPPRDERQN